MSDTYTKSDLIDELLATTGENKATIKRVLESALNIIAVEVNRGRRVELRGFAVFEAKDAPERQGRNPKTGAAITIPAHKRVVVKAKFPAAE
ncbi:HU family DNA-binding protein [Solidesulfovibrio sp.]